MAVLFESRSSGRVVEVRAAGRSRRLYIDGVLHTQHNPGLGLSGGVWDALALAALLAPAGAIRRVLLLGLGGGAVPHLLERYIAPEAIVAVEIDAMCIRLARKYFGLTDLRRVRVLRADALAWVRSYEGTPFDLIIDDLCGEKDGEPIRAVRPDAQWTKELLRLLAPKGVVVLNTFSQEQLIESPLFGSAAPLRRFPTAFSLRDPRFENVIGAASSWVTPPRIFWRRVAHALGTRSPSSRASILPSSLSSSPSSRPTAARRRLLFRLYPVVPRRGSQTADRRRKRNGEDETE